MRLHRRFVFLSVSLAVGCLLVAIDIVTAQGQAKAPFFELKSCERELKVFDDGTVLESRDGKKTERQLSESKLRTLRETLANLPCPLQWQQTLPVPGSPDQKLGDLEVSLGMSPPCYIRQIVSGTRPGGLQQVDLTFRDANSQRGSSVFLACENPSPADREWMKQNGQEYIKPKWKVFLLQIETALGGNSSLKGCDCVTSATAR